MLKKIGLLIIVTLVAALSVSAAGDWRVHPYYVGGSVSNIIDTDSKIYYLVGNNLFCFDKAIGTNESVNKRTCLNDVLVTGIYYNHKKKYLVVTYLNSNIDIIYDDGSIVNLPDIKDAVLSGNKGIYDVTFGDDKILIATDFGLMTYNDITMTVDESRLFSVIIASVAQVGDWTLIARGGVVYAARTSALRETYSAYTAVSGIKSSTSVRLIPISNNRVMVNAASGLITYTLTENGNKLAATSSDTVYTKRATIVQPTPTGYMASFATAAQSYTTDVQGANAQLLQNTNELLSSNPNGDGTIWALGANGLRQNGSDTYYKPNGIGISVGAFYMMFNKPNNKMYLSTSSDNMIAEWGSNMHAVTQMFAHDGSRWEDVTPTGLPGSGVSANWQLALDPMDPNTYVYPSRKYGVFKITNDRYKYRYYASNSYFGDSYYKGACAFDSQGNLWVCYSSATASNAEVNLSVLPRSKYEQATCKKSDWIPVEVPATRQKVFKGSSFVIGKEDVKVYNGGGYQSSFVFWNQPDGLTGDPVIANFNSLQDADGKSITWNYVYCMEKDSDGIVWAGMNNGIVAFDPSKAFDDDFAVMHPKVMRNDGTGLYDHLLDGLQVNCVSVDANNCKWIGTNAAGLYQVSPDGTKILKQFDAENSYLTSNTIYAVCCNTNTNSVYVLTANGVQEYMPDVFPAAANYDDVYVYPNPVRPDFTGLITINNLMNNSFLKIVDAQGTMVKQLQSNGGTATWDCCDETGDRMPTGLYTLYASQQQDDPNPQKVAEFLIIK